MLSSNPNSWFHELGQPLGAMTGSIDAAASAGNAPAAVQGLNPIHPPGHIFGGGIQQSFRPNSFKARIPCSSWYTALSWLVRNNSANFRASIRSLLLPSFNRAALRGSQTTSRLTWGFRRSCNQAAEVPSSKVRDRVPCSP